MTKELLTKEKIKNDLRYKFKNRIMIYRIIHYIFLFFICALAAVLITDFDVLLLIPAIIAIAYIIYVIFMCFDYSRLRKITSGDFYIVEDKLVGMVEKTSSSYTKRIFTFASYGDYVINADHDGGEAFKYSLTDDMFYLVIMNGKNNTPAMVYNQRVYEMKNKNT